MASVSKPDYWENTMRKKRWISLGVVALLAAAAMTVAFASKGTAGSTNTCTYLTPGSPPSQPDCFVVRVDPIYLTKGQTGLISAKFRNVFGSANASHTAITFQPLPQTISATAVSARYIPATGAPPRDVSAGCSLATLSCSFGNVSNGDSAEMLVKITSTVDAGSFVNVPATLTFAEGNGTNVNDSFTAEGTLESVDGTFKGGYCTTNTTNVVKNKTVALLATTGTSGQIANIESLAATGLPCTPIAAGVIDAPLDAGLTTQVSVVAFPGKGTVTLLFPSTKLVPLDAFTFVLKELSVLPVPTGWIDVGSCPTVALGTDACITSETNVTKNGVKYVQDVLTVDSAPPDGHYGG
jgi:hypothetical protein